MSFRTAILRELRTIAGHAWETGDFDRYESATTIAALLSA